MSANASAWPPVMPGTPIDGDVGTWRWVEFPEAKCGNGTPTGLVINKGTDTSKLFIYLSGGGACWDAFTCFTVMSASRFTTGINEAGALQEATAAGNTPLFNRANMANPIKDASYVYIPYCTGDLHSGTRTTTYQAGFEQRPGHHVGWLNMRAFLSRLAATFPSATRVWIGGSSAGGYGASYHWQHARQAFPGARVDLLADGSPLINAWNVYGGWRAAWDMQFPEGCTSCRDSFLDLFRFHRDTAPAGSRHALTTSLQDQVLSTYFGLSPADFEARLRVLLAEFPETGGTHAFVETGNRHTMLGDPANHTAIGGTTLPAWLIAYFNDDPAWSGAGY